MEIADELMAHIRRRCQQCELGQKGDCAKGCVYFKAHKQLLKEGRLDLENNHQRAIRWG